MLISCHSHRYAVFYLSIINLHLVRMRLKQRYIIKRRLTLFQHVLIVYFPNVLSVAINRSNISNNTLFSSLFFPLADLHSPEQREGHLPFQCHISSLHLQPFPSHPPNRHQDPGSLISFQQQCVWTLHDSVMICCWLQGDVCREVRGQRSVTKQATPTAVWAENTNKQTEAACAFIAAGGWSLAAVSPLQSLHCLIRSSCCANAGMLLDF